ncbi:MAG: DUF167 family protein [Gemmatimonadota bacterium]|nr:DUF167 family protein [Gemmatimonadota bacterium]
MTAESLPIHVQPRASKTEVVGLHGEAVKIRIKSPPVDGAANAELERFVASVIDVPKSSVTVVAGATSRKKRISVTGVSASIVKETLLRTAASS